MENLTTAEFKVVLHIVSGGTFHNKFLAAFTCILKKHTAKIPRKSLEGLTSPPLGVQEVEL